MNDREGKRAEDPSTLDGDVGFEGFVLITIMTRFVDIYIGEREDGGLVVLPRSCRKLKKCQKHIYVDCVTAMLKNN